MRFVSTIKEPNIRFSSVEKIQKGSVDDIWILENGNWNDDGVWVVPVSWND